MIEAIHRALYVRLSSRRYFPYLEALIEANKEEIASLFDFLSSGSQPSLATPEKKRDVFEIPAPNMRTLQVKIDNLNKKAKKLKLPLATLEIIKSYEVNPPNPPYTPIMYYTVKVTGEAPIIKGWKWIGVLDHASFPGVTIVHNVGRDNDLIPEHYYSAGSDCEHCHVRRKRNKTYILKNIKTGEIKQVGKSCLQDFLGHRSASQVASYLEYWDNLGLEQLEDLDGEDIEKAGKGYFGISLVDLLRLGIVVIDRQGKYISWKSAESYGGVPTTEAIKLIMSDAYRTPPEKRRGGKFWPTDRQEEKVQNALRWISSIDPAEYAVKRNQDYRFIRNVHEIAKSTHVEPSGFGYALQILTLYERELATSEEERRKEKARGKERFLGEYGKEISSIVTLTRKVSYDTQWGLGVLYVFHDPEGNQIVWSSSSYPKVYRFIQGVWIEQIGLEKGDTLKLSATVADHKEHYEYGKQTIIRRPSFSVLYPSGKNEYDEDVVESTRLEDMHGWTSLEVENFIAQFALFVYQYHEIERDLSERNIREATTTLWEDDEPQLTELWQKYRSRPPGSVSASLNRETADVLRYLVSYAYQEHPDATEIFLLSVRPKLKRKRKRKVKSLIDAMNDLLDDSEQGLHSSRRENPSTAPPGINQYLPLSLVLALEPYAKEMGISETARGRSGFVHQYKKAKGNPKKLGYATLTWSWRDKRNGFVKRHYAQMMNRDWPFFNDDGSPTGWHLALTMWAYSPYQSRLERWIEQGAK